MFGKKKIFGIILITGLLLSMPGDHVSAEEIPEDLPVIVRWEEGGGFDRAGNRITQCWAYDTVSEAGKYVLFDENGAVQKKQLGGPGGSRGVFYGYGAGNRGDSASFWDIRRV